ncbi:ADP-ribosylglycohydrolase-domain-containing protein [Chaetomium sp. MPI-SDFR-AT-0129]|nr:ADP-ribosylglycohydrolase-domain-containing protein [Chaetomium sp. MPI-SDFR-AT-0129]
MPSPATTHLLHTTTQDLIAGVIIGSALGDAIGLYTEFMPASLAATAYPSRSFTLTGTPTNPTPTPFHFDTHRAPFQPGRWTDDTDHALLILLAFLHTARTPTPDEPASSLPLPTQQELAKRLRVWTSQGFKPLGTMPLGLGRLVGSVVSSAGFDSDPESVARGYWERTGKRVAPNGSLMRTWPVGVFCAFRGGFPWDEDGVAKGDGYDGKGEEEAFATAASLSRVTHVDPRCVLSCVIGTGLVRGLLRGEVAVESDIDALIHRALGWYSRQHGNRPKKGDEEPSPNGNPEDENDHKIDESELWKHISPSTTLSQLHLDDQPTIGYVYKTLGAGVTSLRLAIRAVTNTKAAKSTRTKLFEDLTTSLTLHGGDADTNACFAGALLGGYLGYGALPDHWKHGLQHEDWLLQKSDALCRVLGVQEGEYDGSKDADVEPEGGKPVIGQQEMEGRWMVLQQETFRKMEETAKRGVTKAGGSWWQKAVGRG